MKTILVPTDFSDNADNALYYAIELAKKENDKIILLHAYHIDYSNPAVPLDFTREEVNRAAEDSNNQLREASLKIAYAGKIAYECLSVEDSPLEAILNTIQIKNVDLVIMGTKGQTDFLGAIFGSVAAKVIEKSTCPVIAVPAEATFKDIKKITYATAYNYSDVYALKKVVEIAKLFNAQVEILHVTDKANSQIFEKDLMKTFMDDVNHKIQYNNMSFQIYEGDNVEDALEEYIDNDSTNILVMSTHQRGFFDKLFGKSVTKHMAYHSEVPLMAFHHTTKAAVKVF